MSTATRQALVVLGMHRSGTSATAGVLNLLGASEPQHLMPPTPDNPKGYWESVRMMKFHDDLLHASGTAWDDWAPIALDWFESAEAAAARERIPMLLSEEFGEARLLLLKDPRACRLMPLWGPTLLGQGIEPVIVVTLRDARDVADSLQARDGFDVRRGLLLWLRHVLDAEFHTRDLRRAFVRYDDLLTDWRHVVARITAELEIEWPLASEASAHEIDQLLDRSLRHHAAGTATPSIPDTLLASWVVAVSDALSVLCQHAEGADRLRGQAVLDRVREEFDQFANTFRGPIREELHQLRRSASEARREVARVEGDLSTRDAELSAARAALVRERRIVDAQAGTLSEVEGKLVTANRRNDEQIEELAMLTRRMLRAEDQAARTARRRSRAEARLEKRLTLQRATIQAQNAEILALRRSTSWRMTAPVRAVSGRVRSLLLPGILARKD